MSYIEKESLLEWLEQVDGCIADGTVEAPTLYKQMITDIKQFPNAEVVEVDGLIEYCKKCADVAQGLADKIIEKEGRGESEISALGGCAFFLSQARMYRLDIPSVIECFIKESENEQGKAN